MLEAEQPQPEIQAEPKPNKKRTRPATDVYRQVAHEIRKQIKRRGLTMQECDDLSGLNDGHTAHVLHPDTPNGRQAKWETVELLLITIFGPGFRVRIKPSKKYGNGLPAAGIDLKPGAVGRVAIRDFAQIAGLRSAEVRKNFPQWKRRAIVRKAWRTRKRLARQHARTGAGNSP